MMQSSKPKDCDSIVSTVDSMPTVTCKSKNREKMTTEIISKGRAEKIYNCFFNKMNPMENTYYT